MKYLIQILTLTLILFTAGLRSQTYTMSSGTVTTCGGTFYDPGGTGNYALSTTVTATFCATSGCMQVVFTAFDVEDGFDYLAIYDGTSTASPLIGTLSGDMGTQGVTGVEVPTNATFTSSTGCLTFYFVSDNITTAPGWTATISCVTCPSTQNFLISTMNSTESTCSGQFYDSGGSGGNYSNNESYTKTICASNFSTNCVRLTFSTLDLRLNDILTIYDGPSAITGYQAFNCNGCNTAGYIESSTGCFTFVWSSNGANVDPGWAAGIYCFPCNKQVNCLGASTVCGDNSFSGNSGGPGFDELNNTAQGCNANGEVQSSWYIFSPSAGGTIQLSINTTVDYDFAIWGPYSSGSTTSSICPPTTAPLRCSYASTTGNTGLALGSGDNTEGSGGDKWVNEITVLAGEVYLMMVNNFTADGSTFTLDWTMTNGASLACTVLPVELLSFEANKTENGNLVEWKTAQDSKSEKYILQVSNNASDFTDLSTHTAMNGNGIGFGYAYLHQQIKQELNYFYRLKLVDNAGEVTYSKVISLLSEIKNEISEPYPNPADGEIVLDITCNKKSSIHFNLLSQLGKVVKTDELKCVDGMNKIKLDTRGISPGLYYLQITDEDGQKSQIKKIVIN